MNPLRRTVVLDIAMYPCTWRWRGEGGKELMDFGFMYLMAFVCRYLDACSVLIKFSGERKKHCCVPRLVMRSSFMLRTYLTRERKDEVIHGKVVGKGASFGGY